MTRFLALILSLAIGASLVASASGAPDPSVAPCTGIIAADPKGDDTLQPFAIPVSGPLSTVGETPQLDVRSVYLTYRDEVMTGYLSLTNLSKAVPSEAPDDVTWWVEFDRMENGVTSLKAVSDGSTVKFFYGMQEAIGPANAPAEYTETTGKFIEGPDGVVAIDLPKAAGLKAGDKLTGVFGMTTYSSSSSDTPRTFADRAPDDGAASEKSYTLTACPATAAPAGGSPSSDPGATATPAPGPRPGTQPGPSGQPPAQQGQPAPKPASKPTPKKKKASCKAKAKKVKNKKKRKKALKRCAKKKKNKKKSRR